MALMPGALICNIRHCQNCSDSDHWLTLTFYNKIKHRKMLVPILLCDKETESTLNTRGQGHLVVTCPGMLKKLIFDIVPCIATLTF